jgi:hypothetical protein
MASSRFSGMRSAKVFQRSAFFDRPGRYKVRIDKVEVGMTRKKGDSIFVGMTILESSTPDDLIEGGKVVAAGVKPGDQRSYMQSLMDKDTSFPNMLAFMAAVAGIDVNSSGGPRKVEEEIAPGSEELLEEFVSDAQPAKGTILIVNVPQSTNKKGEIRHYPQFLPVPA